MIGGDYIIIWEKDYVNPANSGYRIHKKELIGGGI